jgi:hypothetical protein
MERYYELSAGKGKPFMTSEEYRQWVERFYEEVKPVLDKQGEARRRSEEESTRHYVD